MTELASEETAEPKGPSQEFKQVLALILLTGAIVILGAVFVIQRELGHQREAKKWAVAEFGLLSPTTNRIDDEFSDENNDLVPDALKNPEDWVVPNKLKFSFIPRTDLGDPSQWQPLFERLAEATGIEIEYVEFDSIESQLVALHTGELHITVLNTGSVPMAVNTCGFVPLCTMGHLDQSFGVHTQFIVPAHSPIKRIQQLARKKITFTSSNSNSGFKAPIVILQEDFGMRPGLDYAYAFSNSHEASIAMIAAGEISSATVASDILARSIADGKITRDKFRVIDSTGKYPPGAVGCWYKLDPDTIDKVKTAFLQFELVDWPLGRSLRAESFVEVSYRDDWALIRRIDNAMGRVHSEILAEARDAAGLDSEPSANVILSPEATDEPRERPLDSTEGSSAGDADEPSVLPTVNTSGSQSDIATAAMLLTAAKNPWVAFADLTSQD